MTLAAAKIYTGLTSIPADSIQCSICADRLGYAKSPFSTSEDHESGLNNNLFQDKSKRRRKKMRFILICHPCYSKKVTLTGEFLGQYFSLLLIGGWRVDSIASGKLYEPASYAK